MFYKKKRFFFSRAKTKGGFFGGAVFFLPKELFFRPVLYSEVCIIVLMAPTCIFPEPKHLGEASEIPGPIRRGDVWASP